MRISGTKLASLNVTGAIANKDPILFNNQKGSAATASTIYASAFAKSTSSQAQKYKSVMRSGRHPISTEHASGSLQNKSVNDSYATTINNTHRFHNLSDIGPGVKKHVSSQQ